MIVEKIPRGNLPWSPHVQPLNVLEARDTEAHSNGTV